MNFGLKLRNINLQVTFSNIDAFFCSPMKITFSSATISDLEELIAIRIEAMRESLERIGRFDPTRASTRLRDTFSAPHTRHIDLDGARAGFVVLTPHASGLKLDHLYIRPAFQGQGVGARVLKLVFEEADRLGLNVHVGALKESASNRFYQRHGFVEISTSEWDVEYVRAFTALHSP